MPEEVVNVPGKFKLYSVHRETSERKLLASFLSDEDSDFISSVHGCIADLIRRLHDLLDENDRLDEEKDNQEVRIATLEQEADRYVGQLTAKEDLISELEEQVNEAGSFSSGLCEEIVSLEKELSRLKDLAEVERIEHWKSM